MSDFILSSTPCKRCSRLVSFRMENQKNHPNWYNAPVPSFGKQQSELLIVGLAPGLQGANRTGRPFTGDYAGILLYETLKEYAFLNGKYQADPNDGIELENAFITNAVKCVPPQNKPIAEEINNCLPYLQKTIQSLPNLKAILCLGRLAHESICKAFNLKKARFPFGHGNTYDLTINAQPPIRLYDSYHCSRYNTNTNRLTPIMFKRLFQEIRLFLDQDQREKSRR